MCSGRSCQGHATSGPLSDKVEVRIEDVGTPAQGTRGLQFEPLGQTLFVIEVSKQEAQLGEGVGGVHYLYF